MKGNTLLAGIIGCLCFTELCADIIETPVRANQLIPVITVTVQRNPSTHLYKYSYVVSLSPSSQQAGWYFGLEVSALSNIGNVTSPNGWLFTKYDTKSIVSWGAIDSAELPPNFVDDGNLLESPYDIQPGTSHSGFSFESFSAPGDAKYFVKGFTKIPSVTEDVEELADVGYDIAELDFLTDTAQGTTTAPKDDSALTGGRRPSIDGFLTFINLVDDDVFMGSATIALRFGVAGETVNSSTFGATLNGVDVTPYFHADTTFGADLIAEFGSNPPLKAGNNTLITTVNGLVPGTTRTANDVDRITFTLQ